MCYLVRQQQPASEPGGVRLPGSERLRPRWIAAGAVALAGVAMAAALVTPNSTPELNAKELAAPAPLASPAAAAAAVPVATAVEQRSLPADDDVPTASNQVRAGMGHCEHGL